MPLLSGWFTPHSPLLIPTIGKENTQRLEKTINALRQVQTWITDLQIDSLVILSPHPKKVLPQIQISFNTGYKVDFSEFGDFSARKEYSSDVSLIQTLRNITKKNNFSLQLSQTEFLDYASAIPLEYLTPSLKPCRVVPLNISTESYAKHYEFGKLLKEAAQESHKRIGVIASGDLSHSLTADAPAGFSPQAKIFDEMVMECLEKKRVRSLLRMKSSLATEVYECGLRPLCVLLGMFDEIAFETKILSYEGPFGIGYAVVSFVPQ